MSARRNRADAHRRSVWWLAVAASPLFACVNTHVGSGGDALNSKPETATESNGSAAASNNASQPAAGGVNGRDASVAGSESAGAAAPEMLDAGVERTQPTRIITAEGPGGSDGTACTDTPTEGADSKVTAQQALLSDIGDPFDPVPETRGNSIAISGNMLAVGATRGGQSGVHGSVTMYERSGDTWTRQAVLTPGAGEIDNGYGQVVVLDGDTLVVSASDQFFEMQAGELYGRVHVYMRDEGGWQLKATLHAESPADRDGFGRSIALAGNTLVIGTMSDPGEGKVEVYAGDGAGAWQRVQTLTPIGDPGIHGFGVTLALDGLTLAVGVVPYVNDPGQQVQIFRFTEDGFVPDSVVVPDHMPEFFALSLALRGDTLVVGDLYQGTNDQQSQQMSMSTGAAYVFERGCDGVFEQRAMLNALPQTFGSDFGGQVAIDDGRIVVADVNDGRNASGIDGEAGTVTDANAYGGAVYVFGRSGSNYALLNYVKSTTPVLREKYFGTAIAADSGQVAVGARGEGLAYVFE